MEKYEGIKLETIVFDAEDVIITSPGGGITTPEKP